MKAPSSNPGTVGGTSRVRIVALAIACITLSIVVIALLRRPTDPAEAAEGAIRDFTSGHGDSLRIDLTAVPAARKRAVLALPLTNHLSLGDVATEETCATGAVIIKRPVVNMLESVVATVGSANQQARLSVCNGWRPGAADHSDGGGGTGPHVRGDCLDIAFDIPKMSSREAAVLVANSAVRVGVHGVAIVSDSERYLVHLDPIRPDSWYVEQVWQQADTPSGTKWVTFYQGVDPKSWAASPSISQDPDDLAGDWMASNIVAGQGPSDGSTREAPFHITIFRKPNGHYGMRIPYDDLPDATALWDAVRTGQGAYVVNYRWPHKDPKQGVDEFRGTVEVTRGTAIRNTTQTNSAVPTESTHVNARWVRIAPERRGTDPQLRFHDGALWSQGKRCTGADETAGGGKFIDTQLFPAPVYRESAPKFDSQAR